MVKLVNVKIQLGWKKRKIPQAFKEKWKKLLQAFKESSCGGVCPMFLAELLSILSGKEPGFNGGYSGYDMFGHGGESWSVFAGDLSISRSRDVGEISESWSSVEKNEDETTIKGFPFGMSLTWDGDFGISGMSLTIAGVPDQLLSSINTLAEELFSDVKMETS